VLLVLHRPGHPYFHTHGRGDVHRCPDINRSDARWVQHRAPSCCIVIAEAVNQYLRAVSRLAAIAASPQVCKTALTQLNRSP
jgi:hypothetical protein